MAEMQEKTNKPLPSRVANLPRVGSRAMDERIETLRRDGRQILTLSAYPSRPLPMEILQEARASLDHLAHAPARGLLGLRQALAEYWGTRVGREIDPGREVLVTCGAMHSLLCAMLALLDPGDEVLLFTPSYFFDGTVGFAGGTIKPIPLREDEGWRWRVDLLEKAIGRKTRIILLNTPTNPTGTVATRECMEQIGQLAERYGLFVICDESYDQLVYDGREHVSILNVSANRERNVMATSFTKSLALADWRVGYVIASPTVAEAILKVLEWSVLFGPYLNQRVAELVLRSDLSWLDDVRRQFQTNRDLLVGELLAQKSPDISFALPQGNPFVFINIQHTGLTDEQVAEILLERCGIPCTAGHLHGAGGYVRIPFGGPREAAGEAGRRMVKMLAEIQPRV